ncbi:MAG TPA: hypothetical protein VF247_08285, partial [Candidatus Krumholzibacteria bacterium]
MSNRTRIVLIGVTCALTIAQSAGAADTKAKSNPSKKATTAAPDSTMHIDAGAQGKNFNSITIEGEDRVRVQFDRPELKLDVDPASAPGLDWESVWTALGAESFDFVDPLLERPAYERSPYAPRPWLDSFRDGPVARFRPELSGVEKWSLEVADSRGQTVASFKGDGKPPKEIAWDGKTSAGTPARTDLTYSYVLNATDKAGNKRSFVGDAFTLPPHVSQDKTDISMSFPVPVESVQERVPVAVVLEAATRLNHSAPPTVPVRVEVTAPTASSAKSIADEVVATLTPHLYGDPARINVVTNVDAGSAERASVTIRTAGP